MTRKAAPKSSEASGAVSVERYANKVICADAEEVLREIPDESVHLVVTSPPYWNLVDYGASGQIGQSSYDQYLCDMLRVWREVSRVLAPNGKLCINTPIVPVSKKVMNHSHTRHLKNINNDIESSILGDPACRGLDRYSLYIWQKQTSVKMFGSYPYPPNIYEDNTIEFINVFVKPGKPRILAKAVKDRSKLSQEMWLNLTMQIWPIYPEDVARAGNHPAPFPVVLPQRLILMYTFAAAPDLGFAGDIVLDPFNGSGSTTLAAKLTSRRYIGIDISQEYCDVARHRLEPRKHAMPSIMVPKVRMKSVTAAPPEPALFEGR